ncbi:hypothetical protein GR170_24420 [Pseudooceanicola sp. GBMRC 2024]|uniref:Uncharacterized protein n=1 Tax=Pseudooceanicola albus TaxID=2692189 RepID=A0A6L7GCG8_9RHOB|nr:MULTISPECIES: hypothetical protein [Pseudooceanicola]MXN20976.1 hypothetical protein [Pseudooceanicola albus]
MSGKKKNMAIYDAQGNALMSVKRLERDGNDLVIRGKIFDAMPMAARLTPEDARAALKLLDIKTLLFLLTILFRKSTSPDKTS